MKTIKIKKKKTKMIAHRGLSGIEKENSIRAFTAACNRSYYGCECDIHYTKDKVLVVCHDDFTGRVSTENCIIPDTNFEDLEKIRLKSFGKEETGRDLYIPTFSEYLDIHKKYDKHCIIEIKCHINELEAKEILSMIQENYKKIIFISFDLDNLILIRKLDKHIKLQYLTSKYDDSLITICNENNLGIDILYRELDEERIRKFHEAKIIVNAWTINEKKVAEELVNFGIDFITTNILE